MAQATTSQVWTRIVTLCGLIEDIETALKDWPEDNEPLAEYQLPAIVVKIGAATYIEQSKHRMMVSRQWQLFLAVTHVADDVQDPDIDAVELVEPYLMSVATFFGARPRLENSDAGLVIGSSIAGDDGIGRFNMNSASYMGSIMILTTDTLHTT
jgi:hypothetical protein